MFNQVDRAKHDMGQAESDHRIRDHRAQAVASHSQTSRRYSSAKYRWYESFTYSHRCKNPPFFVGTLAKVLGLIIPDRTQNKLFVLKSRIEVLYHSLRYVIN